jgi:hypothetical protein
MQNINSLDKEQKLRLSALLNEKISQIGGKNFFLNMVETVRETSPHPLVSNTCRFDYEGGRVAWNKVLFQDKIELMWQKSREIGFREDFLHNASPKEHKNLLNLIRTLSPVEFIFRPGSSEAGSGFVLKAFVRDETTGATYLDPVFDAIFFAPKKQIKELIEFENKTIN